MYVLHIYSICMYYIYIVYVCIIYIYIYYMYIYEGKQPRIFIGDVSPQKQVDIDKSI